MIRIISLIISSVSLSIVSLPLFSTTKVDAKPAVNKRSLTPAHKSHGGVVRDLGVPDLIVSRLEYADKELRFRVRNIGQGTKKPGRLYYRLTIQGSGQPARVTTGVAAMATLSRLRRGQESGDNRILRVSLPLRARVTLCINQGQLSRPLLESNYSNNCRTMSGRDLMPDLQVVGGYVVLYKPKKKPSRLRSVGSFLWDIVTGFKFDVSGIAQDKAVIHIRNGGKVPLLSFRVAVGVSVAGQGKTFYLNYLGKLDPGKTVRAKVFLDPNKKWYNNKACCYAVVALDPANKIDESNESNNKKVLSVIRAENIRDHRR